MPLIFLRPEQRLVVQRLGRPLGVRGPGWVVVVPIIERAFLVNLDTELSGWRGLSAAELERRLLASRFEGRA